MGILNWLTGGTVDAISKIATEWIETDKESAEAKAVMIKALDKNGDMRRDIARTVRNLYRLYIIVMMFLLLAQSFKFGDAEGVKLAISSLVDLFIPITAMFTAIVSASFGVNVSNNWKETKLGVNK